MPKKDNKHLDLPGFRLDEATRHKPFELVRSKDDHIGGFFLALGAVYNDLKSFVWFRNILYQALPDDATREEDRGQWNGIGIQVNKYVVAIVHELLILIRKKRRLIRTSEVESVVQMLPGELQDRWNTLVTVATVKGGLRNDSFGNAVTEIRNNLSSHYYDPRGLVGISRSLRS